MEYNFPLKLYIRPENVSTHGTPALALTLFSFQSD